MHDSEQAGGGMRDKTYVKFLIIGHDLGPHTHIYIYIYICIYSSLVGELASLIPPRWARPFSNAADHDSRAYLCALRLCKALGLAAPLHLYEASFRREAVNSAKLKKQVASEQRRATISLESRHLPLSFYFPLLSRSEFVFKGVRSIWWVGFA